jgi:small ligand-binding sensory domain FIST
MHTSSPVSMLRLACGLSGHVHPVKAVDQVCEQVAAGLNGAAVDLLIAFFSPHHTDAARAIAYALRRRLGPRHLLGVSGQAVLGGDKELEQSPGLSVFAASLPGVDLHVFRTEMLMNFVTSQDPVGLSAAAGFSGALRATMILADPFSVPMNALLPAMARVRPAGDASAARRRAPIFGGMASAAGEPGKNALLLDDQVLHEGGIGVSLSGRVRVDALVSQGCRPVGAPMVVTSAKAQIVSGLGGRPALEAIQEVVEGLDERGRQLMQRGGLFLGRAVNEYRSHFGRDDFLIRPIVSVDRGSESIAVGDLMRVGQTVQLHVRDAETAHEDLEMLLDMQRLHDAPSPAGALLFTCHGRGRRLFDAADHDASAVAHAFSRVKAGEEQAKGGVAIPGGAGAGGGRRVMPLAGFFAAGEIGPLGDDVFVHSHTASAAFFRAVAPNAADV